jgi:hypothetical protein
MPAVPLHRVAPLPLLLLLTACASAPSSGTAPLPPVPPPGADTPPLPTAPPLSPSGLVPLPTPRQVVAALPVGRRDPFGSLQPPQRSLPAGGGATRPGGSSIPSPLQAPSTFVLTGVIRSGGLSEAVVQYGAQTGTLRPGDRGGTSTDLLPPGWSVASIDVQKGRLTLQSARQRVTVEL